MNQFMRMFLAHSLIAAVVIFSVTTAAAQPADLEGTVWPVSGLSLLKVKKVGKMAGVTVGTIEFKTGDQFVLELDDLMTLTGGYRASRNNRRIALDLDPEAVEEARDALLEVMNAEEAVRGFMRERVQLKLKLRTKKDEHAAMVRLKVRFTVLLALPPADPDDQGPEVVEDFKVMYRYRAESIPSQ